MNQKQAHMLDILSRTHSLSEAAIEMGTSQPRLTQQLKVVEKELGVELFHRSPRGLLLSEAGQIFLPYARQIISTFLQAQEALSSLSEGKANCLRLGASITASHQLAPENLLLFHKRYPEVLVIVTRALPKDLVKGLEEGRFDLCFGLELPESALFQREEFFKTDLVGLSSAASRPALRTSLAKFCRRPLALVTRSCDSRILLDDALRRVGVKPRVVLEADDVTAVLAMVRAGVASTILPRTLAPSSKTLLISDLTDLTIEVRGMLLYPRKCTTETRKFIQLMQERIRPSTQ
jgi:DNA-binding transcriptional LysR family regulator